MEETTGVIRKEGDEWVIFSKEGKRLGSYPSKEAALKRLREIEFFKHQGGVQVLGEIYVKEAPTMFVLEEVAAPNKTIASLEDLSNYVIGIDTSNE